MDFYILFLSPEDFFLIVILVILNIVCYTYNEKLVAENKKIKFDVKTLKKNTTNKDQLFTIISHDIRSPLHAVKMMYIDIINVIENNKNFDTTLYIKKRIIEIEKINSSIKNLLHQYYKNTKTINSTPQNINLNKIINKVLNDLTFTVKKKKIKALCSISEDATWYADPNTTFTILRNLIDNSIKYSHFNSTIYIKGKKCKETSNSIITIKDTGIGMSEATIEKLLQHTSITKENHGKKISSGIGFQLCKKLAKKNNIRIDIKSNIGTGTTIILKQPIQ